jgi:hypothetical protein
MKAPPAPFDAARLTKPGADSSNSPARLKRDAGDEEEQHEDYARILELERPAERRAAGAQGQQAATEREADQHHARGIGQRLAARIAALGIGLGQAQRLEAQDREDAGHDVEDKAAEHCTQEGQHRRAPRHCGGRRLGRRHRAGDGLHPEALLAESEQPLDRPDRLDAAGLDQHAVTVAGHLLGRGIVDGVMRGGEEIALAFRLGSGGERDGEAQRLALDLIGSLCAQRLGQRRAPRVELGAAIGRHHAVAHLQDRREVGLARHADRIGADEIVEMHPDREIALGIRRHLQRHQRCERAFIDIVHQPRDQQPLRHRIADLAGGGARRQGPFGPRRQPGIARIEPIGVPALFGHRSERERHLAARRRPFALGDQADIDMLLARRLRRSHAGKQAQQQRHQSETNRRHGASLPRKSCWPNSSPAGFAHAGGHPRP